MAGSYPDAPSRRIAWDDDGTILTQTRLTPSYIPTAEVSDSNKAILNNEQPDSATSPTVTLGDGWTYYNSFIFPELREVDGIFVQSRTTFNTSPLESSSDSTNGEDGTWATVLASLIPISQLDGTGYRDDITSLAVSNVRVLRWHSAETGGGGGSNWYSAHLYGEITPGQTPDRLLYIDNDTGLEFNLPIDYGDVPRGSASDEAIKIRNNSGSLTANTVQVTGEALYRGSGAWYTFSEGGAFQSTLALASSIGPGADSPVITVRRIIPDSEALGLYAGRIQTSVASWT